MVEGRSGALSGAPRVGHPCIRVRLASCDEAQFLEEVVRRERVVVVGDSRGRDRCRRRRVVPRASSAAGWFGVGVACVGSGRAITDVEFDTDSGVVVRVVTDQGPIEPDWLRSLGSFALVVDDASATTGP